MPPVADAVAPPFENPLQLTLESTTADATSAVGSVIVVLWVAVKPALSVTVTV